MDPIVKAAGEAAAIEIKKIPIKDYLRMPQDLRPRILKEADVEVSLGEGVIGTVKVKQLTKTGAIALSKQVISEMPERPSSSCPLPINPTAEHPIRWTARVSNRTCSRISS